MVLKKSALSRAGQKYGTRDDAVKRPARRKKALPGGPRDFGKGKRFSFRLVHLASIESALPWSL
jgi:hypothetical protein